LANLYQKIPILVILGAVGPDFKTHSGEIWHEGANQGLPAQAKFCKNRSRGYTPFGQIYTQNYQFWWFGGCKPTF